MASRARSNDQGRDDQVGTALWKIMVCQLADRVGSFQAARSSPQTAGNSSIDPQAAPRRGGCG